MTLRIDLPPEIEAALKVKAETYGLTVDQWLLQLAKQEIETSAEPLALLQKTNPQEWARRFEAWARGHDPNLPVLSDEAMSRESIYPDRI
jgi:hypothetical protein